jgi:chromosome segregation ATPase
MPRGRPIGTTTGTDTEKKRLNRERVNRHKTKVAREVEMIGDDLINCEQERATLNTKVKTLTNLLKNCEDQVSSIMTDVKKMGTKKPKAPTSTKMAAASTIAGAMRGKIARNKMKAQEKQATFDILLR